MYKSNKRKSKLFKILSKFSYWLFFGLFILFAVLSAQNSIGNVTDIIRLLDKDTYNREQIAVNYTMLVAKWGEWSIIGSEGSAYEVKFVDIKQAMFSGLMITYLLLAGLALILTIFLGKLIFPKLSAYYVENNQDMVNLATLDTQAKIAEIKTETKVKTKKDERWF